MLNPGEVLDRNKHMIGGTQKKIFLPHGFVYINIGCTVQNMHIRMTRVDHCCPCFGTAHWTPIAPRKRLDQCRADDSCAGFRLHIQFKVLKLAIPFEGVEVIV